MLGFQPAVMRPQVRAYMAQAPTAPPAAAPPAPAPGAAPAAPRAPGTAKGGKIPTKTLALVASGAGVLGGGAAAYCSLNLKKKGSTPLIVAGLFTALNVGILAYTLIEG